MTDALEVFQDLNLRGPINRRPELRQILIKTTCPPWHFDAGRSEEIKANALSADDVLAFRHDEQQDLPAAGLTLWSTDDGYYVSNIVPQRLGKLSFSQYNGILADFVAKVLAPVAPTYSFVIELTQSHQGIDEFLSPDAASKLRRFSAAANKSTGASHPLDRRRWSDFLIAAHRSRKSVGADIIMRWLQEVDGWDEESASELACEYERSLDLLAFYDEN